MIRIKTNLNAVIKRFMRQTKAMDSLPLKAHRDIAVMLDRWVLMNFRAQGRKVGGWKPFRVYCVGGPRSPYIKTKTCGRGRVKGKGRSRHLDKTAQLLQDTGTLRKSFTRGVFYSETDAGIGTEIDYAEPHEKGLGHLPQRRMLPNKGEVLSDIIKIYQQHMQQVIKVK